MNDDTHSAGHGTPISLEWLMKEVPAAIARGALLTLKLPDGREFGDLTGAECREIGDRFAELHADTLASAFARRKSSGKS